MSDVILIVVLIAACMCIAFGAVRIGGWLIGQQEAASHRALRESTLIADAQEWVKDRDYSIAMLDQEANSEDYCDASHWTPREEAEYQRQLARRQEIEASKRGDLIAAACFAELSEVDRG